MKQDKEVRMKQGWVYGIIAVLLLFLAACNTSRPTDEVPSALFSEDALSSATTVRIVAEVEVIGVDKEDLELLDLDGDVAVSDAAWVDGEGALSTQAVLAGVDGMLSYYRTNGSTYQIYIHDQATDVATQLYSGTIPVQSVASSLDGNYALASFNINGQYDVYLYDIAAGTVVQLTNTSNKDELDVSMTADAKKLAWTSETNAGLKRITVCDFESATNSCSLSQLSSGDDQIQGSISSNGEFVALIRDEGGRYRVRLYEFAGNTYTSVISRTEVLSHPSVSNDGLTVVYLRDRTAANGNMIIRVADLVGGTIVNQLSDPYLTHVHVTADGGYVAYDSLNSNGDRRAFTRNMTTKDRASAAGGSWDYYAPYWQRNFVIVPAFGSISGNVAHGTASVWGELNDSGVDLGTQGIEVEAFDLDEWMKTAVPGQDYLEGEVLVGFVDLSVPGASASIETINEELKALSAALAADYNLEVMGTSPALFVARMRTTTGQSVVDMMTAIRSDRRVKYVEPNGLVWSHQIGDDGSTSPGVFTGEIEPSSTIPTDPAYASQRWHYTMVGAQRAWDTQRGSSTVRVAVLDTGIFRTHLDAPAIIAPFGEQADFVSAGTVPICSGGTLRTNYDGTGYDNDAREWMAWRWNSGSGCAIEPNSAGSHGTHVAGTIAAAWNNGQGGVGVAPGVRIIPIQVLGTVGGGSWYDVSQGVLYAGGLPADNGSGGTWTIPGGAAHIANMSLGGSGGSATLQTAVTNASNNGTLIIASAGNAGTTTQQYPAAYSEVVAVTALGADRTIAGYSSRGSWVELTAPGGNLGWTGSPQLGVHSTTVNYASSSCAAVPAGSCFDESSSLSNYANYNGTSMAAPHVAAVAALYKSHNSALTRAQLRTALRNNASDIGATGFDTLYGYGLVQAAPGVARVLSSGARRVVLFNAATGALAGAMNTTAAGNYSFTNVPNGQYWVLGASNPNGNGVFGEIGESIGGYAIGSMWLSTVTVNGNDRTGISFTLGNPINSPLSSPNSIDFAIPGLWRYIPITSTTTERWLQLRVPSGRSYRFYTEGYNTLTCDADFYKNEFNSRIRIYAADATTLLADSNNIGGSTPTFSYCSEINTMLSPGNYYVRISGVVPSGGSGTYYVAFRVE